MRWLEALIMRTCSPMKNCPKIWILKLRCFHGMKFLRPLKNSKEWLIKKNDIMLSQQESLEIIFCVLAFFLLYGAIIFYDDLWLLFSQWQFLQWLQMWGKNVAIAKINCFFQPQYNPMIDFTSTIQYVQCHGIFYFEELLHGSMLLNFLSKAHDRGRPCDA